MSIRIAVFLNGARGIGIVQALNANGYNVAGIFGGDEVFTRTITELSEADRAKFVAVDHRSPESWEIIAGILRDRMIDLGIVAGFARILPPTILNLPTHGFLNLHAGRLPQYRGGSPLNWQLLQGERTAGVSVIRMTPRLDDGDVVLQGSIPIDSSTDIADLHAMANAMFAKLVLRILGDLAAHLEGARPQDPEAAQYWHQRSDADGRFLPRMTNVRSLDTLVRAITRPYPGAWALLGASRVRLYSVGPSTIALRGTPGRIVQLGVEPPHLILIDGSVAIHDHLVEQESRRLRNGDFLE